MKVHKYSAHVLKNCRKHINMHPYACTHIDIYNLVSMHKHT